MRSVLLPLAAATALLTTPAFAAADQGPYIGAALTHDSIGGTGNAEGVGINGVGGSVFVGYNLPISSRAFVGAEANFDLASAGSDRLGLEADHSIGVSARLGFHLSDSAALYGRVGYQSGRFGFDELGEGRAFEAHDSFDGLRLGVGVEANVSRRLAVRAEYNHTHYYLDDLRSSDDAGLANNQVALGIVYGF